MTARYLTTSGSAAAPVQPGGCACGQQAGGCGPANAPACGDCDTDCLSRPNFYCGMVLTDDQLNDLSQWVRRRAALHRYVEGWGAVRGLAVRCDPASPGGVIVGPGYARSCCGDDIVLCADVSVDACACGPPDPCCGDAGQGDPGGGDQPRRRAVDLYLRYTETPQDQATVRASCGCGGHDSVQYERVTEGGTVVCRPVADPSTDPETLAAREWDRGYAASATVVADYLREVSDRAAIKDRLKWILGWIDRAQDDALCCIRDGLCRDGFGEAGAAGALVEIVYALRSRYLETTYGQCQCPAGVLLARVWLREDDQSRCTVECIDAYPPFRRGITAPGWPRLPGFINVAGLIWQRRAIACEQAGRLGLRVNWSPYLAPKRVADLAGLFDGDSAFVRCDAECEARLYRDRCGHWAGEEPDGRVLRLRPAG
jgi:hypothetical protein